jgi:hypothetical protein
VSLAVEGILWQRLENPFATIPNQISFLIFFLMTKITSFIKASKTINSYSF